MADDNEPTVDSKGRKAKHRLTNMLSTAVGLVDHPANLETFLIVKARDGMATKADDQDDDEGGLRLPAAAKQSLTDGLADTLEKLAAIAQQIQDCEVDESAECPPELAAQIDEIADDLDELADEFAPKASPTDMAAGAKKRMMSKAAKAAFPGAAPPFKSKGAEVEKADGPYPPDDKNLGTGGPDVKRGRPGEGGGADDSNPQPRNTTTNPAAVMKSGRKMAKERLAMLQKGHDCHAAAMALHQQGHAAIGQVLSDVGGGSPMQPAALTSQPVPMQQETAPVEKAATASSVKDAVAAVVNEALGAALGPVAKQLADMQATQKSLGDAFALDLRRKQTGLPLSNPGDHNPPAAPRKQESWPSDMSAEIKKRPSA